MRQARPAWAEGLTQEQILAARGDENKAQEATLWLAEQNAGALRPLLGREPMEFEIGLAHQLGPRAAAAAINAPAGTPLRQALEQSIGPRWTARYIEANPQFANLTTDALVNRLTAAYAPPGGPRVIAQAPPGPRVAGPELAATYEASPMQTANALETPAGPAPVAAPAARVPAAPQATAAAPARPAPRGPGNSVLSTLSPQGLNAFRGMLIADPEKALQWMLQQEGALATRQTRTVSADGRVRELLPDGSLGRDYGAANDGPPPRTIIANGRVFELKPDGSLGRDYGAASDRDNKVFERERELRNDLNKRLETYQVVESNFRRMATLYRPEGMTGAQDIGLVYSYMKMLDPGSVVREGEAASANNAAGVPEAVRAMYNRLIGGGTLSDAARAQMIGAAQQVFASERGNAEQIREQFRTIAPQYEGLNADRVAPALQTPPRVTQAEPPARPQAGFTPQQFRSMSEAQLIALGDNPAQLNPQERAALAAEVQRRLRAAGVQ